MATHAEHFVGEIEELLKRGDSAAAEQLCLRVIEADPSQAQAWAHLSFLQTSRGDMRGGEKSIRQAIDLDPTNNAFWNNLSAALLYQKKFDEARDCANRSLSLGNQTAAPWVNLALAAFGQKKFQEACDASQQTLAISPNDATAWANLGTSKRELGRLDEAIAALRRAAELSPGEADIHIKLGSTLEAAARFDEAAASFHKALEIEPHSGPAHWHCGIISLRCGDFEHGWPELERGGDLWLTPRRFQEPKWNGQPFEGKVLLIYVEHGLGDTIQFIRYVPLVKKLGGTVIVECQGALQPLLHNCDGIDQLVAKDDQLPPLDFQYPLTRLPGIFKTTINSIPNRAPYLHASPSLVEHWARRLGTSNAFRIAINWTGEATHAPNRHIPASYFAGLGQLPGVELISVQKSTSDNVSLSQDFTAPIIDFGPTLDEQSGAFMDTAAIMKNVDLVITSDTSIAHLAGALAVPVWAVLPLVADWRWFLDRSDSPWYPTMRLFRQKLWDDWNGVFADIRTTLADCMDDRQNRRRE